MSQRTVVLLGMGHTHLHVLREWMRSPLPNVRLLCLNDRPRAVYSGMLPGVLSGQYDDLAGVHTISIPDIVRGPRAGWSIGELVYLNLHDRRLRWRDESADAAVEVSIPFDVLSVGVGSVPHCTAEIDAGAAWVPIKPMQDFLERFAREIVRFRDRGLVRQPRIAVVGGGAGGVEIALCAPWFVQRVWAGGEEHGAFGDVAVRIRQMLQKDRTPADVPREARWMIIDGGSRILDGSSWGLRRRVLRELRKRNVDVRLGSAVSKVTPELVELENGTRMSADIVIWAAGAAAAPVLKKFDLPKDRRGFLLTRESLHTTADAPVFAVGDCGTIDGKAVPKAGVYAVRQGPVLWENIERILTGRPLRKFVPQKSFLKLLNTGRSRAIGEYFGVAFEGAWAWRLKDRIDRGFVEQYQRLEGSQSSVGGDSPLDELAPRTP